MMVVFHNLAKKGLAPYPNILFQFGENGMSHARVYLKQILFQMYPHAMTSAVAKSFDWNELELFHYTMICVVRPYTCHDYGWLWNISPISPTAMDITRIVTRACYPVQR